MSLPVSHMTPYLVNTMGYVVADGRSNWLEGVILVCKLTFRSLCEILC